MNADETASREALARDVRHNVVAQITVDTHRLFRVLFPFQWLVAVVLAWQTDVAADSRLLSTFILGGMLCVPAGLFTLAAPQSSWVRHWTGLTQIGWSFLFMWLLTGRSEAQFHVFASLALLAFYRDWSVLLSASIAAAAYPAVRLALLPDSYLVSDSAWWRIVDQVTWLLAENVMLLVAIAHNRRSIIRFALASAEVQANHERVTQAMSDRTRELERSREQFRLIAETTRAIPFELNVGEGRFTYIGPQAAGMLGFPEARCREAGFLDQLVPVEREPGTRQMIAECPPGSFETLCSVVTGDNRVLELRWTVSCEYVNGARVLRGLMIDVTEARRLVRELAQGQKLESVGRIAAGVAHEINTSVQFISDSVRFVRHALRDVPVALADYRALAAGVLSGKDVTAAARKAHDTDEAADVDYFLKNAPDALDRALEGIGRIGSVVKSMTEFAHPDALVKTDVDLNRAIRTTLNMARNEYKNVAELVTDFGDIPRVYCHPGDINQVVLNLLLNAAHAIGDLVGSCGQKGTITVRTRALGEFVEVSVSDTGGGIPEAVRGRIFEPFFTTKEVGRGAGQGLALSRGIVVDKLRGSLHFETATGQGTTFHIRLPISGPATDATSINEQAAA